MSPLPQLITEGAQNGNRTIDISGAFANYGKGGQVPAKLGQGPQLETTTYSRVEAALVTAYNVPDGDVGRFSARLTALQKGGLFGAKHQPGKGKALAYGSDQIHRLIFCVELAELGVAPGVALKLVEDLWDRRIRPIFLQAEAVKKPGDDDIVLHMGGVSLMVGGWASAVPNINRSPLRKLPADMAQWMKMDDDPLPPRAVVVNLSARLRRFHAALRAANERHAT
jgi:hypothetical protein